MLNNEIPYRLLLGDIRETLKKQPAESVQCCVTSPPYFGLRDYKTEGQIGLEKTPSEYVEELVAVFREIKRVLKKDGTLWLNLGDSYSAPNGRSNGGTCARGPNTALAHMSKAQENSGKRQFELPAKNLIGIPWRVAFALQEDGWYLRQDIIWHKPNPMPESVTDRCTKAHEYIFLFAKQPRYYFDHEAIKEPTTGREPGNKTHKHTTDYEAGNEQSRTKAGLVAYAERRKRDSFKREDSKRAEAIPGQTVGTHRPDREESGYDLTTRNKRDVWTVATKPYKEAHFATFPPKLIEPCILAGSRPGDTVLDPFSGAGTTGVVALENGRKYLGGELNPSYVLLSIKRLRKAHKK